MSTVLTAIQYHAAEMVYTVHSREELTVLCKAIRNTLL